MKQLISVLLLVVLLCSCVKKDRVDAEGSYGNKPHVTAFSTAITSQGTLNVAINGSGFEAGASVEIKNTNCSEVTVENSEFLTCILPVVIEFSLEEILVTNPNGLSNAAENAAVRSGETPLTPKGPSISTTAQSASASNSYNGVIGPTNARSNDGTFAFINMGTSGDPSDYLRLTDYFSTSGTSVPGGATITGIKVNCKWADNGTAVGATSRIQLLKAGVPEGISKSSGAALPTSPALSSDFGGSSDLWGGTWSASDINASNFGIQIEFLDGLGGGNPNYAARVDYCLISVHWVL